MSVWTSQALEHFPDALLALVDLTCVPVGGRCTETDTSTILCLMLVRVRTICMVVGSFMYFSRVPRTNAYMSRNTFSLYTLRDMTTTAEDACALHSSCFLPFCPSVCFFDVRDPLGVEDQ